MLCFEPGFESVAMLFYPNIVGAREVRWNNTCACCCCLCEYRFAARLCGCRVLAVDTVPFGVKYLGGVVQDVADENCLLAPILKFQNEVAGCVARVQCQCDSRRHNMTFIDQFSLAGVEDRLYAVLEYVSIHLRAHRGGA